MRVFLDTSVLVAALIEDQPGHLPSLQAVTGGEPGWVSVHSLAECFATLTGGRLSKRLTPGEASTILEALSKRVRLVRLTEDEYLASLRVAEAVGARGGAIYDVLILSCARQAQAERILTLNHRHFVSFAPDLAGLIATPG